MKRHHKIHANSEECEETETMIVKKIAGRQMVEIPLISE
jgi:hypothetical protein